MNFSQRVVSRLTSTASVRDLIRIEASKLLPSLASFFFMTQEEAERVELPQVRIYELSSSANMDGHKSKLQIFLRRAQGKIQFLKKLRRKKWSKCRKATKSQEKTRILKKWCSMEAMKSLESRNNRDWTLRLKEKVLLQLKQKNATRRLSFQGKSKVKVPSYQANKARTREQRRSLSILNSCRGKKKKHLPKEFKVWRHQKIFGTSSMLEEPCLDWLAYIWVIDS